MNDLNMEKLPERWGEDYKNRLRSKTPKQRFDIYIGNIREGIGVVTNYELAKDVAELYGLESEELKEAIDMGCKKEFDFYLRQIESGGLYLEEPAREFIRYFGEQYGFQLEEIEKAIKDGIKAKYDQLMFIFGKNFGLGTGTEMAKSSLEFAQRYDFPELTFKIEAAIKRGEDFLSCFYEREGGEKNGQAL